MTEALEQRLIAIFDGLDNDIVTVSDAIFLREFIKAQAVVVEQLKDQINDLENKNYELEMGDDL